jgi:hypothetical protein
MRAIFLTVIVFLTTSIVQGASPDWNWEGPYRPCRNHYDLLSREHMDLGVRISTSNLVLAEQFGRAMNFWSEILDMTWHEAGADNCSVQLVEGTPELFASSDGYTWATARAQLPDRGGFQGWIAFNPALSSTTEQMFRDAVHEIGHLFGLHHNPSVLSVMYFDDFGQDRSLDLADLRALAEMHKLRPLILGQVTLEHAAQGVKIVTSQKEQSGLQ